jgi:nucleoside-diphosphate-sugar epimerase
MKAILTGADGNLGRRIIEHADFECLPVSRGNWDSLNNIETAEYQALIHCAYDLKTDINDYPDTVLESNVVSTGKALRLCKEKQISRMVFISSCSVYGDSSNSAEDKACIPVSINGFTKLFNEELVKSFCDANAIDYLILRPFNSYGGDDTFSVVRKLISCARDKHSFTLVNEGIAERDFIHVADVAKVVCALAGTPLKREVINVGSGKSVRIIDLLHAVEERFGKISVVGKQKPGEAVYSRANINKLKKLVDLQAIDVFDFIRDLD